MVKIDELRASDLEDAVMLHENAEVATAFVQRDFGLDVGLDGYFIDGIANVFAVFVFFLAGASDGWESIWVIVGDVPPGYFDTRTWPTLQSVIAGYLEHMREWASAVKQGLPTEDLIPVLTADGKYRMNPTLEIAELLETKLAGIEEIVIPWLNSGPA